jgi:Na+-transporting NADH:ubiquinone oxidoreductase subunit NqrF
LEKKIMKNVFHKCAFTLGIAAMVTASSLNASMIMTEKVAIPFNFQVARTTLPAGEYRVQQQFGSDIAYLVNLKTGQQVQVLRSVGEKKDGRAKLVFQNTASGHVLKTIS